MARTPKHLSGIGPTIIAIGLVLLTAARAGADTPTVIQCRVDATDAASSDDVTLQVENALYLDDDPYLLFTAGGCKISNTIKLTNLEGLRIEGEGWDRTTLYWEGPAGVPMFSVQNSSGVSFAHFRVCVSNTSNLVIHQIGYELESVFDVYNACFDGHPTPSEPDSCHSYDAGDGPGSHGNSFSNLRLASCHGPNSTLNYGIRFRLHPDYDETTSDDCDGAKEADCGNDGHMVTHVHLNGPREAVAVIEGRQSVGHVFRNCTVFGRYGDSTVQDADGNWVFNPDGYLQAGILTGRSSIPDTSGSFSWYGGQICGVVDSVFVVGSNPRKILVSGLYSERVRMLLRTLDGESATSGGIVIESTRLQTSWSGDYYWNADQTEPPLAPGELYDLYGQFGTMIGVRNGAPLSMRGNIIGDMGTRTGDLLSGYTYFEPDNASICWAFPEGEEERSDASFVFAGNSFGTDNENPFHPRTSSEPYDYVDDCIYPTQQDSNLIATGYDGEDESNYLNPTAINTWEAMPQHFSTLEPSGTDTFSILHRPTSHEFFNVVGGWITARSVACLEDGVAGDRVVLIGASDTPTTVEAASLCVYSSDPESGNLVLQNDQAMILDRDDTLTLVKGSDECWYEVGRKETSIAP